MIQHSDHKKIIHNHRYLHNIVNIRFNVNNSLMVACILNLEMAFESARVKDIDEFPKPMIRFVINFFKDNYVFVTGTLPLPI